MKPPLPPEEPKRLEALAGYRVLDSPREDSFDDITRLAAHVCEAPTALISLVDRDRQWFKSRVGSDSQETSRDVSFCAHAILEPDDIMLVSDARTDPRFADNPLVTNPGGIRFYAGAPLVTPSGQALGTLCVIDKVPRSLSPEQIAALRALRRMVMLELETRRQTEQLQDAQAALEGKVAERTRALRESEELYRHLLEATDSLVQSVGPDGRIQFVNRSWRAKLGYSEAEALGKHFEEILHPSCRDACRAAFARVMAGEDVKDLAAAFVTGDGRELLVEGNAAPRFESGRVIATHGFFRDVTEKRRAAESLDRERQLLHAVVDNVEAGILACDADGVLTLFNRTARGYYGLAPDADLPPADWAKAYALYRPDGKTLLAPEEVPLFRALSGHPVRDVAVMIKPGGKPARELLVSGQPMLDEQGRKLGAVIAINDVTDIKRAQEQLRRKDEALHQSEKLAAMGQLLAGVAHELNNPLAIVMGLASLLQRATRGTDQAARAEKIERAAERCARIVKNFLAMARQQPPERRRVAINQTVEAALELVAYPLRSDGVEVRTDLGAGLPMLWADGHQLQQVLINLLTNAHHAVRQSDPPRRVTVSTALDPERQRLVVDVADNGPGIPPEVMPRIFDPFFTTKREGEGTGLGLSLCHGIVEAHGGSLSVESEPGHGAAFKIVLPIEASIAADVSLAKPAERAAQRSRSVLVVDDEPDFLGVLADMLREEGHEVVAAASGNDALRTASGRSFDLVLSDMRMPELDGPGLYQELVYRNPEMAGRFVFMTGDTLTPATRDFLARTPVAHLAKPFDQEQLREALERALGGEAGQPSRQR